MGRFIRENARALIFAVLVHLVLIGMLLISLDWSPKTSLFGGSKEEPVMQAVVVDETKVQAEIEKLRAVERHKKQKEEARRQQLEKKALAAKKAREREQRRIAELKKKRVAEKKKLQQAEKKRLAVEQEKRKMEQERQARQKEMAALEAKRKKEERRLAEVEAKRKKEQERQRKLEEKKRRREEEQALQEQIALEQQRLEEERNRQAETLMEQYVAIIRQKVTRNWLRPPGTPSGLSCTVSVRLIPGGEVVEARVTVSSGNALFDRSVETAVLKASPLPLPPDPTLFPRFRELRFLFNPEE